MASGKWSKMRKDKRRDREMTRENMWVTSPLSKMVSFILPLFFPTCPQGKLWVCSKTAPPLSGQEQK